MTSILICGLPGSGKTTLAKELITKLPSVLWLNADAIRTEFDDWDFSMDGRLRQVNRLHSLATATGCDFVVCDFVAPTTEIRKIFNADYTIWMDTIEKGRYDDTNKLFKNPKSYNYKITQHSNSHIDKILSDITYV